MLYKRKMFYFLSNFCLKLVFCYKFDSFEYKNLFFG